VIGRATESHVGAVTVHTAAVLHGRGIVYVATADTTDAKWSETSWASADTPPLSLDQVAAIAESASWTH
jgi:hypothetical protein